MAYSSLAFISNKQKKKITLHRTFIKWLWLQSAFFAVHFVFWPKMASNGLKMRNSTRQYLPSLDAINKGGEGISMLVYVFFLGWLEKYKNAFFAKKRQHFILPIFLRVVEFEILCITTKPYILQKILLHWFCQNSWHCYIGIVIFDSRHHEGWLNFLIEVAQWLQKPKKFNQFWVTTSNWNPQWVLKKST